MDRILKSGGVWLDNQRVYSRDTVILSGKTLKVFISPTQDVRYVLPDYSVVDETVDWIVVLKPRGLSTVPDRACERFNLTAAVEAYLKTKGIGYVPTAISRLDLMVGGIVIFPKHKLAEKRLFEMMRTHQIVKRYRMKISRPVEGCIKNVVLPVDFNRKAIVCDHGKPSRTIFIRDQRFDNEWVAIPVTGRRHQIRLHAATVLSPILGDTMYGGRRASEFGLTATGLNFNWDGHRVRVRFSGPVDSIRQVEGAIVGPGVQPVPE